MEVNNREWALAIWLTLILVTVLLVPTTRRSVGTILRLLASRQILPLLVLMVLYVGGVIATFISLGVWDAKLITPTIVWFLTIALVSFFRVNRAMTERHYFRNLAAETVAAPVFVQFVLDIYPFSLLTEICLQGGFLILGLFIGFSASKPEHHYVHLGSKAIMTILGVVVAMHSVMEIINQWSTIDFMSEVRKFALPIGMTIAFLPFMYGLTWYAAYQSSVSRMRATGPAGTPMAKPAIALALEAGLSVRKLAVVTPRTRMAMSRAGSIREARAALREGQAAEAARQQEAADRQRRLLENAGLQGVDEFGRRLDQREFQETKAALDYLQLCHQGHYQRLGRYRDDMLDVIGADTFASKGLPADAHITMHVSPDGQKWWAWRRTVSGWVFAIGANAAPPDRWEFDGPDVPSGGPGTDPAWRHFMVPAEAHEHW